MTADIVKAGAAADAGADSRVQAAASTTPVTLCVEVLPSAASTARGQATKWAVSAWTTGGNVPAATIQLQTSPANAGTPVFTSGCGINGTSSCNLGAVDATAAHRQLQAQFTVPVTATTISSVGLTATMSAANLPAALLATGSMSISTSPNPVTATSQNPLTASSPVGSLPTLGITAPSASMSPGGSASGLFPTLNPSASASSPTTEGAKQVADTSALSGTSSPTGAELAGLAALALAVVLAVTRLSIRRPAPPAAGKATAGTAGTPGTPPKDPEVSQTPKASELPSAPWAPQAIEASKAPAAESSKGPDGAGGSDTASLDAGKPDA